MQVFFYFNIIDNTFIIQLRKEYCKNNNIRLIRIPYWEINNIEEILIKELNIKIEKTFND